MSENIGAPAAMDEAGHSGAEYDASAVAATARREGEAAGARAALDRFATIVAADGIKGNAARIGAAIDLAVKSPNMCAEDVVAFVIANIATESAWATSPASLAARMIAGADPLAVSEQPNATCATAGWNKAISQANARFGKDAA